jgi:hypothetical protein
MRGRIAFGLLLSAALTVGCASNKQTAEQKREAQALKAQQKQEAQARKAEEKKAKERAGDRHWEIGQHMFRHEDEPTLVDAFAQRAAANGALEDADFSDAHFDGADLNSLGRSKLWLLMSAATPGSATPITVYVAGDPAKAQARIASLDKNHKASKYADILLAAKEGRNPAVTFPAADGIQALEDMKKEGSQDYSSSDTNSQQVGDALGVPRQ